MPISRNAEGVHGESNVRNPWSTRVAAMVLRYWSSDTTPVSSEVSDFTPSAHARSDILHVEYAEKTDY